MSGLEIAIYNLVKKIPWLKFFLRNLYQSLFDLLPKKREYLPFSYQFMENCFFGFHDLNPFSYDNTKVLTNRTTIDLKMPRKDEPLEVGYIGLMNENMNKFHKVDSSYSWNFHKGCRLQWFSDQKIIFNTAINDQTISKIVDIETQEERIINYPIDTLYKSKIATSFSYERLERCMPGYGYPYKDESFLQDFAPKETGLFVVDLIENKRKLLVSIYDLVNDLRDDKYKTGYWHFITHSEFSEDGRYISFFHRWIGDDVKRRWARLIIYDLNKGNWFSLPTNEWGVSHYVWNSKNQIVAYCNIENSDCHVLFDIPSVKYKKVGEEKLNSDGHQTFVGTDAFITDTYPDKYRMSKLYKVCLSSNDVKLLISIYSPKQFQTKDYSKHIACDLHPRTSKDGNYLCFDSPRTGKRSLYVMRLNSN